VDVKTPGSGEPATDLAWLDRLMPHDEVKFVVCSEEDFRWSEQIVRSHRLPERLGVLFSPAWGKVDPKDLARWLLESGLRIAIIAILAYLVIRVGSAATRRFEREMSSGTGLDVVERTKRAQTLSRLIQRTLAIAVSGIAVLCR